MVDMKYSSTLSFQLHSLVYGIDALAGRIVARHSDISFPQFLVLLCVFYNPATSQKHASHWLNLSEATVSYMVKILLAKGYISVTRPSTDVRQKLLDLTPSGRTVVDFVYPLLEEALRPHFLVLPEDELSRLLSSIEALQKSIHNTNNERCE